MRPTRRDRDSHGDKKLWRLGVSELIPTDSQRQGSARVWARWMFLQVLAARVPDVLVDLRTRATTTCSVTRNNTPDAFVQYWRLPDWTLPYVLATWRFAAEHPDVRLPGWLDRDDVSGHLVPETDDCAAPEYDPTLETRAAYLQRVHQYIEDTEATAASTGDVTTRPRKDPRAFEWLVDHLVNRKSYADIWKSDSTVRHRNTVPNACKELLALLNDKKLAQK